MRHREPTRPAAGAVVLIADHGSTEGSRHTVSLAVERVTGTRPVCLDARHFMTGGCGRLQVRDRLLSLTVPDDNLAVAPAAVLVYEIPPASRPRFSGFLTSLRRYGFPYQDGEVDGWRNATEKDRTITCFLRDGIPFPETVVFRDGDPASALDTFHRFGGDVWTRPSVGMSGSDVIRVRTPQHLQGVAARYARTGQTWLMSRDAGNFTERGERHSLRIVVLDGKPLWAVEHLQSDPDRPTNEAAGAVSTRVPLDTLPEKVVATAVAAVRSVGLRFGGVDVTVDVTSARPSVFEVNVHPLLRPERHLDTVAIPWVQAHLFSSKSMA